MSRVRFLRASRVMTGIAGFLRHDYEPAVASRFLDSTDLLLTGCTAALSRGPASVRVSAADDRWLEQRRVDTPEVAVAMAGQPLFEPGQSWDRLMRELRAGQTSALSELGGRFALALIDQREPVLYLITDRLAQYPLYLHQNTHGVAFSTSQASFCVLPSAPAINPGWVFETFLVNFSASHQSFLSGVRRLPPATVVRVDLSSGEMDESRYAPAFVARPRDARPEEDVARAREIFAARMPRYLRESEHGLIGLSAGFDSRTLLAYCAELPNVTTFTYGVPGCTDMVDATALATELRLRHFVIPFDAAFTEALPNHMRDAVWLSSGHERAARATLVHVYRTCADRTSPPWCALSGVSADQLFRGHGNVPAIVSPSMDALFRTGQWPESLPAMCSEIFVRGDDAMEAMHTLRTQLEHTRGNQRASAAHLAYMTYEVPPEYFAGEASIADQFGDFRSPFCDPQIVELAHTTSLSTLGLSKFALGSHDNLRENYLPAALILSNAHVSGARIHGKPVQVYARRARSAFEVYRIAGWLQKRLHGQLHRPPLENWSSWFRGALYPTIRALLGDDARVTEHVNRAFVTSCLERRDTFWLNKLATAEMVLRLAESGWNRQSL
jgi:asparagine synthetase B (glutamine-hydrolysing)